MGTGVSSVGYVGSQADKSVKLDPVLAKRFAQQQEKCSTADDFGLVFFAPGPLGIEANWDSGVITSIVTGGQAERLGIKTGWQFHTLHEGGISEPWSRKRLDDFIGGTQSYGLTFTES